MSLDIIPEEKPRVDLSDLPQTNELKLVRTQVVEAQKGKTGGVIFYYVDREGNEIPQKYSRVSGSVLKKAIIALGYADLKPLMEKWHVYKLTPMRVGFPRYIPTGVAKKQ